MALVEEVHHLGMLDLGELETMFSFVVFAFLTLKVFDMKKGEQVFVLVLKADDMIRYDKIGYYVFFTRLLDNEQVL